MNWTLTLFKSATASTDFTVEVSSNLVDWFRGVAHTTVRVDNERLVKVRDNTPIADGGKRFIRVSAGGDE